MEHFLTIVAVCNGITSIMALILLLIKPLREKLMGLESIREGQRCLMRSSILLIYDRHYKEDKISAYEKENALYLYEAYKALGGNSFVEDVMAEIRKWEVETTLDTRKATAQG